VTRSPAHARTTRGRTGKIRGTSRRSSYDSDTSSSSPKDEDNNNSSTEKMVNQNYYFNYSRILYNSNAHLLSIPLGKPPHFDGGRLFILES
jgi:hypothetical protein